MALRASVPDEERDALSRPMERASRWKARARQRALERRERLDPRPARVAPPLGVLIGVTSGPGDGPERRPTARLARGPSRSRRRPCRARWGLVGCQETRRPRWRSWLHGADLTAATPGLLGQLLDVDPRWARPWTTEPAPLHHGRKQPCPFAHPDSVRKALAPSSRPHRVRHRHARRGGPPGRAPCTGVWGRPPTRAWCSSPLESCEGGARRCPSPSCRPRRRPRAGSRHGPDLARLRRDALRRPGLPLRGRGLPARRRAGRLPAARRRLHGPRERLAPRGSQRAGHVARSPPGRPRPGSSPAASP